MTAPLRPADLATADLVALAALKLIVEVDADPSAAFGHVEAAPRRWLLRFLADGPGAIGADPIDASSLGRARAWQIEVARQRRMAELYRPASDPAPVSSSGEVAVQTFAALSALEDEDVWVEVSEIEAAPGFAPSSDPWSLPVEVTATQMFDA